MRTVVAILAGGRGERLWPTSRTRLPKQFLRLIGNETFLQQAHRRAMLLAPPEDILVATGSVHVPLVQEQLPMLPADQILAEPVSRDTAASVALVSARAAERAGAPVVVACLPADQVIFDHTAFAEAMHRAIAAAEREACPVLLGVPPTRPESNYGYIERGDELHGGVFRVQRFHEKPDLTRAAQYLAEGNFLWNSGIFVCRSDTLAEALSRHLPHLADTLQRRTGWDPEALQEALENAPRISLDHGLLERVERVLVIPVTMAWDDVGNWDALLRLHPRDDGGNVLRGRVVASETSGSVIYGASTGRLVVTHGLQDMVVVDTVDSTLVAARKALGGLRGALEAVRASGHGGYLEAAASLEATLPDIPAQGSSSSSVDTLPWSDGSARALVVRLPAGGTFCFPEATTACTVLRGSGRMGQQTMGPGATCELSPPSETWFAADGPSLLLIDLRASVQGG